MFTVGLLIIHSNSSQIQFVLQQGINSAGSSLWNRSRQRTRTNYLCAALGWLPKSSHQGASPEGFILHHSTWMTFSTRWRRGALWWMSGCQVREETTTNKLCGRVMLCAGVSCIHASSNKMKYPLEMSKSATCAYWKEPRYIQRQSNSTAPKQTLPWAMSISGCSFWMQLSILAASQQHTNSSWHSLKDPSIFPGKN